MADPIWDSVDSLWKDLTDPTSLAALLESIGSIDVTRFFEAVEVDEPVAAPTISAESVAAFRSAFEQHRQEQRFEQITIAEIEQVVNARAAVPYLRAEITLLLESWRDEGKVMIVDDAIYPTD